MTSIKRRLLLMFFLLVGVLGGIMSVFWLIGSIIFAPFGTRSMNIIIALDRLFNVASGGNGQETLSSRAGRLKQDTRWACTLCKFLDLLEKDHCKNSIGV